MRTCKVIFYAALILVISCSKKNDGGGTNTQDKAVDTINSMDIDVRKFSQGYDTTDNFITDYIVGYKAGDPINGSQGSANAKVYTYTSTDYTSNMYTVKYVGGGDLVDPADIRSRWGAIDAFYIRKALLGKPLLEIHDLKTGKLVKTYVCASDSAIVMFNYSVWDNLTITPKQNADALNYYLNVKQGDWLHYYYVPN